VFLLATATLWACGEDDSSATEPYSRAGSDADPSAGGDQCSEHEARNTYAGTRKQDETLAGQHAVTRVPNDVAVFAAVLGQRGTVGLPISGSFLKIRVWARRAVPGGSARLDAGLREGCAPSRVDRLLARQVRVVAELDVMRLEIGKGVTIAAIFGRLLLLLEHGDGLAVRYPSLAGERDGETGLFAAALRPRM